MQRLVFIDDDEAELDAFRGIVEGHYDYTTVHWPSESAKLFSLAPPDIFVSDLCLPSSDGDTVPTKAQKDEATGEAKKVAGRFLRLYSNASLNDKARLRETMNAIRDANALLKLQWSALGQAPDNGVDLLSEIKARYPDVPFVFYSRKITPEDVIRVLQAGAEDAIRKSAFKDEDVLSRLAAAQDFYRSEGAHKMRAHGFNANITLLKNE